MLSHLFACSVCSGMFEKACISMVTGDLYKNDVNVNIVVFVST